MGGEEFLDSNTTVWNSKLETRNPTSEIRDPELMDLRQITVPTPLDIGPVHLYLVRHDPLTLIDAGPKHPESWKALHAGLQQHGVKIQQIQRLVLTHSHEDHFGQACAVQEASSCEIFIHDWELENVLARTDY